MSDLEVSDKTSVGLPLRNLIGLASAVAVGTWAADFKEYPIMIGYLKEEPDNAHTFIYFVNKEMTTSSLVVSKKSADREQACIIWSGKSPSGMAFSVNPNPMFADEL
jgi:hypothetical protein